MKKRKSSSEASDREKRWEQIFNALVTLSQNLQKDRQFLEERIKFLNQFIYQMKMEQKFASSKAELILGLKDREASIYKHRYENTEIDSSDLRVWLDYICNNRLNDGIDEGENELRKVKSEFEKYKLKKSAEISGLLAEKKMIWNQQKEMEGNFSLQLRKKCEEMEETLVNMQELVKKGEELESENQKLRSEKDEIKAESIRKNEEISQLMMEIEVLKSKSGKSTDSTQGRVKRAKKESNSPHTSGKMSCGHTKPTARKSTGGKGPKKQLFTNRSTRHGPK